MVLPRSNIPPRLIISSLIRRCIVARAELVISRYNFTMTEPSSTTQKKKQIVLILVRSHSTQALQWSLRTTITLGVSLMRRLVFQRRVQRRTPVDTESILHYNRLELELFQLFNSFLVTMIVLRIRLARIRSLRKLVQIQVLP